MNQNELQSPQSNETSGARILVIFPCLNEEAYLERLLSQFEPVLENQDVRFVIADGGSTDKTPAIARNLAAKNPRISFLENPKKYQSAAVNIAVETFGSNAEYLIRIDVHADYPNDYCQKLIAEAEKQGADSVVVSMKTEGRTPFQKAVALAQNSLLGNGGSNHRRAEGEGRWIDHGHHALMRVDAFKQVGGYDASFSHNEDAELDCRLGRAGKKIWLTGATFMTYYPRATALSLFKQYDKYGQGRARNILKNKIRPKIRQLVPLGVAPAVALSLLAPLHWIFALPALVWRAGCLGYGASLGLSKQKDLMFLIGPAAMIMHLGWSLGFLRIFLIPRNLRSLFAKTA